MRKKACLNGGTAADGVFLSTLFVFFKKSVKTEKALCVLVDCSTILYRGLE